MTEKNKFQKKFERLPEEARSVIDEFDFEEVLEEIKNEYSLSEHQVQVFDGEVAAALVLDRHPNNMKENLIAPDNGETFNPELADDLHFEFHMRILEPIMQEMEKRGISFGDDSKEHSKSSKRTGSVFEGKYVRVTKDKIQKGGSSFPVRNISKVTDFYISNWSFGGAAVNIGAFALGLIALGQGVGGIIVGIILMAIGGFNVYNMINEPYQYIVKAELLSSDEISIKYSQKEKAKKLRDAIESVM
jgi:hypothetical protein